VRPRPTRTVQLVTGRQGGVDYDFPTRLELKILSRILLEVPSVSGESSSGICVPGTSTTSSIAPPLDCRRLADIKTRIYNKRIHTYG
jgi:hypothetical protein